MTKLSSQKKHADFQSNYRRSFNFRRNIQKDAWVLNENGELVLRGINDSDSLD